MSDPKEELMAAAAVVNACVHMLRPHVSLFERYEREQRLLASAGPVLAPALFLDRERTAVDAVVGPMFAAARDLVSKFDEQISKSSAALAEVKARG